MNKPTVLGVDIGGSHITSALIDLTAGTVIKESIRRKPVNSKGSLAELLSSWTEVINASFNEIPINERKIGIAFPGPFDYEKGVSMIKDQDKFRALYSVDVNKELAKSLGLPPTNIKFVNDASAFMQGEVLSGAAKGYKNVVGLTLGTGLGSAISVNGIAQDVALWDSPFLGGIAEDYFSTRWFVNKYEHLTGRCFEGVKELAAIVDTDPFAKQIFNEFGIGLGHFLADVIKANHSEIVVLGGNIAQAYDLFAPHLINSLKTNQLETPVKLALLNEEATLIGAANQWKHQ